MKNTSALLIAALTASGLLAGSSPKLEFSWKNPNYNGAKFTNVMVLALNGKAENRAEFEDELTAAIARPGQNATQSYQFIPRPDGAPLDVSDLKYQIREQRFDAVVAARLTKRVDKTTYVPGETYTPFPYYTTFYGYYTAVSQFIYTPGYMETEKEAQVEVNFYSTAKPDGELVWTGTTNTFDAKSPRNVIRDLVKVVSKELEKEKIIAPKLE